MNRYQVSQFNLDEAAERVTNLVQDSVRVRTDYIGRGYQVESCVAVVGNSPAVPGLFLAELARSLREDGEDGDELVARIAGATRQDALGYESVWYWVNLRVS